MLLKAKWVLPIAKKPIPDGGVLVQDDKIIAVGTADELTALYPSEKITDFGQAALMPGFVDLHTHLEFSVFRGVCDDLDFSRWKIQLALKSRLMNPEDWQASARLGALEAIRSGITTIADITATGASLDAAIKGGLRGRVYLEITGMDHSKTDVIIDAGRRGVDDWRRRAEGTVLDIGVSPHSPYTVSPPLYRAVSDWANAEKLSVSTHLAGSKDEYNFIKYGSSILAGRYRHIMGWDDMLWQPTGVSPVKYLLQWGIFDTDILAIHCVHIDGDDLAILEKHDVAIAHCPKCNAKLGMGIAPLSEFRHRKLRLGLGTDSPASSNTMDIFDEMRISLLLQRGVTESAESSSAASFLREATIGGAEALRLEDQIGTLETGKQADIIAVDISHIHQSKIVDPYSAIVYLANQENVMFTMVGGVALFEKGKYLTLDEDNIVEETELISAKLLQN